MIIEFVGGPWDGDRREQEPKWVSCTPYPRAPKLEDTPGVRMQGQYDRTDEILDDGTCLWRWTEA